MKPESIVSFLKLIFSFLSDCFPLCVLSEEETESSPKFRKLNFARLSYLPALMILFLSSPVINNQVYGQGCNPLLRGCPGDIVVYVQPGTCGNNVTWTPPVMTGPCPGYTVTGNFNPGDYFNSGTTQVVYYSWFGTEKKDSCKFNVIVVDNQKPVVNCKDISLYLGPAGNATLKASDIDNGSSDNCSLVLIPGRTNFTCADAGLTIPVVLTGTDPSGNSSTCTAQVTVMDTTRPVIITKEFELLLDNSGSGTIQASDIDNGTYDNCGPVTLSVTPTNFSCSDQGFETVTFTATDSNGNTAVSNVRIAVVSSLKINSVSLSNCDAAGTYALFNSTVTGGSGSYTYFWDCLNDAVNPFVKAIVFYPFVTFVNTSTEITPFFNNNIPDGTYTIRLVVTDGNGCRDTSEMMIVKSGPVYSNIVRRHSTACEGSTVTYTVNPDPVATFDWNVTNGTILSSPPYTNTIDVLWNLGVTEGVVVSTLNKTNMIGDPCSSTVIDTVAIDLLPPPVFVNPAPTVCAGSEITYTLTMPYSEYEWTVTGGAVVAGGSGFNFVKIRWNSVPAGRVNVVVRTGADCSASAYTDVSINNLSGSITSVTDITCNGAMNGMVTAEAAAATGVAPYTYSLDGGADQSSGSFTNIGPGTHIVTVRDAILCTYDLSFTITQPQLLIATASKTDVACFGDLTGSISAAASGGTPPYEYNLNGGSYQATGIFSGLPAGLHTLTVRDGNSCSFVLKIDITQPDALTGSAAVSEAIKCHGGTATVTLTGGGGTPPLSYTFNGVSNTTGIFTGITAKTGYVWSITDANGCGPFTGSLDVTEPAVLTGSAAVTTAISCNGGSATVTLTASGGTAPLSFTFNGVTNTTGIFSGIPAGAGYAWSITDANNCGPVTGSLNVTQPSIITGSASVTVPVPCNGGTATIRIIGGGGTAPLSFTFNGNTNTTGIFTGITAGNGYTWSVNDANGCAPATGAIDVTQPAVITGSAAITSPVLCFGGTGVVTLTGGGGTSPLSYTFNGVTNTTGIFSGVSAGTGYIWSITDANSCNPVTGAIDMPQPAAITASASVTSAITCFGGTATVTILGSGGTAPLSYTFNGVTNSTGVFAGIAAGAAYSWSVTDANNCGPFTGTLAVTQPALLTGSAAVTTPVPCFGGNATVTLTSAGGTAPVSFTFNGVTNTTGIFTGIPAGTGYAWSITDVSGCGPVTGSLNVIQPQPITGSAIVTVPVPCNGATGMVRITGAGGTEPLSYTLNGITNTTGIFTGIAAGTGYFWSISDANGCTPATGTIDVTEPTLLTGSAAVTAEIVCYGGTATVSLSASGGTAPISYTFNGVTNTTGVFAGITAGTAYPWSITDAANCGPVTGALDVLQPAQLNASAVVSSVVACTGGTATVTITATGGTAPLTFTFNGITNSTGIFTGIAAGLNYPWSVDDAAACGPVTGSLNVTEPLPVNGSASVSTPVPCNGGTATVTLTGNGGTLPYSFTFNGIPNTTGEFTGVTPGTGYQWIVNDANGCAPASGTIDVTEPEIITGSISVSSPIICNGGTTTITLSGSGGTAPLVYTFNEISNSTGIFTGITAGTAYQWSITDVNSCSPVTGVIDIPEPPPLVITITSQNNVTVIGGNDGSLTAEGSGGTPPYLYRLNNGSFQVSGTFSNLIAGNYTVTVQDAALCEDFQNLTITDPSVPLSGAEVSKNPVSCFGGNNGSLTVTGIAGIAPYEYSLNGVDYQSSGTFTGLTAGTYIVTIRDAKPTTFPVTVVITEPETAVSVIATGIDNLCNGDNTGGVIAVATGGTEPYEFSWNSSPVQMNDTAFNLPAGTYQVTVTDANGCNADDEVTISGPPAIVISVSSTEADCPDTNDGSINLTISGGTAPYNFFWEDGNTSQNRTELLPGNYKVTVTDANGCPAMTTATVGFIGTFGCVEIPQIITPNNDGFNDEWRIRNIDLYPQAEVLVYSRWGKLVYKSRNISADPWDGRFNGSLMPTDSYHYILYLNDGSKPRSGVISIIR